jgi:hypothetical protein
VEEAGAELVGAALMQRVSLTMKFSAPNRLSYLDVEATALEEALLDAPEPAVMEKLPEYEIFGEVKKVKA